MFNFASLYQKTAIIFMIGLSASFSFGQQSVVTLRGQVADQQNAVIIGATVEATDADGKIKTAVTNDAGEFTLSGLAPGKYTVRASQAGFAAYENSDVNVAANARVPLNITLGIAVEQQVVTVGAENPVSTEPDNNADAIVLKGADIDALPDNPDDLEAALQALAGPGAGPNGGQIYIDGFTDGRLPPKSSIREVRINSNPLSAEYDRIGFGRIEIFTKPGTDKFRGQGFFNFNDESLNSRNPFADSRASYQSRQFGGNVSGPISKRASFFLDFERRSIDDLAVINATTLDSNFNVTPFSQSVSTPLTRTTFSPHLDYQLNADNTVTARYGFTKTSNENSGIGGFSLASRAYNTAATEHNLQLTETAVINKSIINETRSQFLSRGTENSGGANVGNSSNNEKR